jgi:hypothetical protein
LAPGGDVVLSDTWDTTGAEPGVYTIVGSVEYGGQSAGPRGVVVHSRRQLYLPLVRK